MIILITGVILMLIGIWAMLTQKNIIRIIIGFSIVDTGIHLIMVVAGYVRGKTAPILDKSVYEIGSEISAAVEKVVDPLPSALVLTAIVIGLAVTALLLTFTVRLHKFGKSLHIDDYEEIKW